MVRNLFILPDGRELFSGPGADPAIQSVTYTPMVNAETDLDYGAACAAMVEVTLLDSTGQFALRAGDEIQYFRVDDAGNRKRMGYFLLEIPTKNSPNTYRFTAYDRMLLLEKDLTDWLTALNNWPYPMQDLLSMVCGECALALDTGVTLPNGGYHVPRFLQSVTGRQLVKWIAGANGAYAAITPEGKLTFRTFTHSGALTLPIKSMKLTDYETPWIHRVTVKQTREDVGITWPEGETGECYTILGNPMLATLSREALLPCLEAIAQRVMGPGYTPAQIQVFDPEGICVPGTYYTVTDRSGTQRRTAVFSVTHRGGISTLHSTGNPSRGSATAAVRADEVKILQGQLLQVKTGLEEVSTTLSRTVITAEGVKQEQSSLQQRLEGIESRVSETEQDADSLRQQYTVISQRADGVDLAVTRLEESLEGKADQSQVTEITEHFRFGSDGLTISNTATGMGIGVSEERVIFTGGEDPTTKIYPDRMQTTTLQVGHRLDVGGFGLIPRTNGNLSLRYIGGDSGWQN